MALFHIRQTENTTVTAKAGVKRTDNLLYTILPFGAVLDDRCPRPLDKLKLSEAQRKWREKVELAVPDLSTAGGKIYPAAIRKDHPAHRPKGTAEGRF